MNEREHRVDEPEHRVDEPEDRVDEPEDRVDESEERVDERGERSIEEEVTVDAPPGEVWEALTTSEGLRRWFPLDGRVDPGEGGKVWLSWGPGMEASAPIHVWDPPRRFGWTESYGEDEAGRPVRVAVEFHVEGRSGTTVVRVTQSGFGASAEWDEMYDAVRDGWRYFLFNLGFWFREHRGVDRDMVWRRFATDLSREATWDRLTSGAFVRLEPDAAASASEKAKPPAEGNTLQSGRSAPKAGAPLSVSLDRPVRGTVVSARAGHHLAAELAELERSLLFVELEGRHVGVWLSTYGLPAAHVAALQAALDERVDQAFGSR